MKILMATWSWRPVGGDWTYIENLKSLYRNHGYEVIPFSTKHEDNVPTPYDKYFISGHDYKILNEKKNLGNSLKALKNAIVSVEAINNLKKLVRDHDIAFAHLHVIHHWLTPAIIWVLKKNKIPIIWTLHDFKLICPQGSFDSNGIICEKCFKHKYYNCTLNKCKKKSYLASFLASADAYFYNIKGTLKKADYYLCPSKFLLTKYKKFGYDENKLILANTCYDIDSLDQVSRGILQSQKRREQQKFILFVGRIEREKGVYTLIKAVAGTAINLKIAGKGAAYVDLVDYVQNNKMNNVEFLGFQPKETIYELILKSSFTICPSECYENYPFSVIESLLLRKPVIGAKIGGIPELIIDGKTGLLFRSGDVKDLRGKIKKLWIDSDYSKQMGENSRDFAYQKFNFEQHWAILEKTIKKLPIKANAE